MTSKRLIFLLVAAMICGTATQVTGAYYRFDPVEPYNLDGDVVACDTVYLQWIYEGDTSATHVITTPLFGLTGFYGFDSTVAEAGQYKILMEFVDNSESVRFLHEELFEAKDTVADVATGFATHSQVDSLKDTTEDMSTRLLATGFSTHAAGDVFDVTTDGHTGAGTFGLMLETCSTGVAGIKAKTDKLDFDGSDSLLVDLSTLNDLSASEVQSECEDAIVSKFIFDNDSVVADQSTMVAVGDTNKIQGTTDTDLDSALQAIADANKLNFMADVSGLSTLDSAFLSTFLKRLIFGISQGIGSDSTTLAQRLVTASGLGSGDTNQYSLADVIDAIATAVGDSNLARYSKRADYRADISGLSTLTDVQLRDALHDSLYTVRMDSLVSVLALATTTDANVLNLVYYWGACDGCYYRLYPEGGFANKDSAIIIDPSKGADSLVGKVIYLHGTEVDVVDTSYFYVDEPW